jgi:hypothetical protein
MRKYLTNTVEILYLSRMLRWERMAPPDRHKGFLDGVSEFNSQTARLAYVVKLIAAGTEDRVYKVFERFTRRDDDHSYISKDWSWMNGPYALSSGWYFEGCTSLEQKQQCIRCVTQLGLSPIFERCFDDFVAGQSVADYMPTHEEQEAILERLRKRGELVLDNSETTTLIE